MTSAARFRVARTENEDGQYLNLRRMDQVEPVRVQGTQNAQQPFFSPDGQWIGFYAGNRIQRVSVSGGLPVTLAEAPIIYHGKSKTKVLP